VVITYVETYFYTLTINVIFLETKPACTSVGIADRPKIFVWSVMDDCFAREGEVSGSGNYGGLAPSNNVLMPIRRIL